MTEHPTTAGSATSRLPAAATALARLAAEVAPELAQPAAALAARLSAGRFHIGVVGEFKRGKSTLVNALVGRPVLPTGVLPLTSVAVEIAHGPPGAVAELASGQRRDIGLDGLRAYATEEGNPANRFRVRRVMVSLPATLLAGGVVLVDTPGLGSVHAHNTAAALEAIASADGAVVVLSADAPLSQQERDLVAGLRGRSARMFFVLNRADNLACGELEQVLRFVTATLAEELGRPVEVYPLSARRALAARTGGRVADPGFDAFARDLGAFVEHDLAAARDALARRELHALADRLDAAAALEAAALELTVENLAERLARFRAAARDQRRAFAEDRLLLAHAAERIAAGAAADLAAEIANEPLAATRRLAAIAAGTPPAELADALDRAVGELVRERFDALRPRLLAQVERDWNAAAAEFRGRVEARVAAVRRVAEREFDRPLPPLAAPPVSATGEAFSYQLERLPRTGEATARVLQRLLPPAVVRRRLVARARRRLTCELDKHAGRARHDLSLRLERAHAAFADALAAHLDEFTDAVAAAAERAAASRSTAGVQLAAERRRLADVRCRTDAVRHEAAGAGRP